MKKSESLNIQELEWKLLYSKLVKDHPHGSYDSLIGKIAYSEYISQRQKYITRKYEDEKRIPNNEELQVAIEYLSHGDAIDSLRISAKDELDDYSSNLIYNDFEKIIKKKSNFFLSVLASMLAAFVYSVIIAVVLFTATKDPNSKLGRIIDIIFAEENISIRSEQKSSNKLLKQGTANP